MIKNEKLAKFIIALVNARNHQKKLRLLRNALCFINGFLTTTTGFRIAAGGSLSYIQIILIVFPSTIGGFLTGAISDYPLVSAALPIAILLNRGIKDIEDPSEKCRIMCKVAEEYHNKQLMLEMKNMSSLVEEAATAMQLPIDEVPLSCVEQRLSLLERYKLKEVIKSDKTRQRVQHFSEFIKKFPECEVDPEEVYQEVMENVEKIPIKN